MHHLMLVTLSLPEGGNSEDARDSAYDLLMEDDSFVGEGGRFGSPLADWFVIGGRWSGLLKKTLLGEPYQAAFEREFPEALMDKDWYPRNPLVEKYRDRLNQVWHRLGGTGTHPLSRSGYDHYGAHDDAMLVDPILYEHFLKPYAGSAHNLGDDKLPDFADLDGDEVDESFIGRKWLVVVDYHN